jgi:hypothetical protein
MAARAPVDAGVHLLQCGLTRLCNPRAARFWLRRETADLVGKAGAPERGDARRGRKFGAPSHSCETQEEQSLVLRNIYGRRRLAAPRVSRVHEARIEGMGVRNTGTSTDLKC